MPEAILWVKLTKGSQKQEGCCCLQSLAYERICLSPYFSVSFHFALVLAIIFLQFNSPMPRKITKARRLPNNGQASLGCSAVSVRETFPCEHVGSTCSPKAANGSLSESSMNLQTAEFSSLSLRRLHCLQHPQSLENLFCLHVSQPSPPRKGKNNN